MQNQEPYLPTVGFVRLPQILEVFPVSASTWWAGVKSGRFPAAVKLTPNTTAWRAEDILTLIDRTERSVHVDRADESQQHYGVS